MTATTATNPFILRIYTHPTGRGAPVGAVETAHPTAAAAMAALRRHDRPYWLADVVWDDGFGQRHGVAPDGSPCAPDNPARVCVRGTGGEHPAHLRYLGDRARLVAAVAGRVRAGDGRGTVAVAAELLAADHPETCGLAAVVGELAAARVAAGAD